MHRTTDRTREPVVSLIDYVITTLTAGGATNDVVVNVLDAINNSDEPADDIEELLSGRIDDDALDAVLALVA